MRLTTGEVRSYDKKIELGYNHKKERRQIILDSQYPITVRLIDVAKIKRKIRVYVKKQIRFPTICYNTNGRKSYQPPLITNDLHNSRIWSEEFLYFIYFK